MAADRERFPLPERLFLAYTAVSRWATSGSITSPDSPGRRRGCANPFALFKILLFLLVILLLPIFVLPMMLVRLVESGRQSFRYGASVDITAGDEARWGHGILPPVPGDAVIRSGGAAIANGDPGFRVTALTDWAVAATALNCQSLVSGDATCTRTFMANGLYRAHQAMLELRAPFGRILRRRVAGGRCRCRRGHPEPACRTGAGSGALRGVANGTARAHRPHAARRP